MKDLIAKLEAAPEAEQEGLILEALQLAYSHSWITHYMFMRARRWALLGAYLSAAVVLVPEGWWWSINQSGGPMKGGQNDLSPIYTTTLFRPRLEVRGTQGTPALAVAIAAMKTRDETETAAGDTSILKGDGSA